LLTVREVKHKLMPTKQLLNFHERARGLLGVALPGVAAFVGRVVLGRIAVSSIFSSHVVSSRLAACGEAMAGFVGLTRTTGSRARRWRREAGGLRPTGSVERQ
jgi:hypothetical protein